MPAFSELNTSSWPEIYDIKDREWFEKARERMQGSSTFHIKQYEDSDKKRHIVVGDPNDLKSTVSVDKSPEGNASICVFFAADKEGPLFALPVRDEYILHIPPGVNTAYVPKDQAYNHHLGASEYLNENKFFDEYKSFTVSTFTDWLQKKPKGVRWDTYEEALRDDEYDE